MISADLTKDLTPFSFNKPFINVDFLSNVRFISENYAEGGDVIENLSNNDGDGNGNGKNAIGWISKTTTLHVHHAVLYISLPSLHNCNVKVPNFTFCRGREHKTTTFFFFS